MAYNKCELLQLQQWHFTKVDVCFGSSEAVSVVALHVYHVDGSYNVP